MPSDRRYHQAAVLHRRLFNALVAAVVLSLFASIGQARCSDAVFTPAESLKLKLDAALVVVHASSAYDPRYATKHGIDAAVRWAKSRKIPVIYLADDHPLSTYFPDDCQPDHWVYSEGGEINFELDVGHLYLAGGHLETCLSTSVHDLLYQASKRPERPLKVSYFLDAIYSNVKSVDASASYAREIEWLLGVLTYGRPHGERWPKLTLLELVGAIRRPADILAYLRSVLPHWERTFSARYRASIQLDAMPPLTLRRGDGLLAPALEFLFVESAGSED